MKTTNYKLRAEFIGDVLKFMKKASCIISDYKLKSTKYSTEFEFSSDETIDVILMVLSDIKDGHVMFQSLNYKKFYTGERDYNRTIPHYL